MIKLNKNLILKNEIEKKIKDNKKKVQNPSELKTSN
jgi:hypothetical protein